MSGKPEITESEAVLLCVQDVWMAIGIRWSAIRRELEAYSFPPGTLDGGRAPFELMLAAMGLQIRSAESLLSTGPARRVRDLLLAHFVSEHGRGALSVLEAHDAAWRESQAGGQSATLGPALVMAKRLGYAPTDMAGPSGAASAPGSPVLLGIAGILERYGTPDWWRRLLESSRLVPDADAPPAV
jgi:hypothetical protein